MKRVLNRTSRRSLRAENARLQVVLADTQRENEELRHNQARDPHFPVYLNRRGFAEAVARVQQREWDQIVSLKTESIIDYWVVALDFDDFKSINDTYGHAAGDSVIAALAPYLRDDVLDDPEAIIARFGGDEFILLVDGEGYARLCNADRALTLDLVDENGTRVRTDQVRITMSAGIAAFHPFAELGDLIHAADLALNRAKALPGKGSVVTHESTMGVPAEGRPGARVRDLPPLWTEAA
jgi:diguanylate cyclase (GGDEF)-like protein